MRLERKEPSITGRENEKKKNLGRLAVRHGTCRLIRMACKPMSRNGVVNICFTVLYMAVGNCGEGGI